MYEKGRFFVLLGILAAVSPVWKPFINVIWATLGRLKASWLAFHTPSKRTHSSQTNKSPWFFRGNDRTADQHWLLRLLPTKRQTHAWDYSETTGNPAKLLPCDRTEPWAIQDKHGTTRHLHQERRPLSGFAEALDQSHFAIYSGALFVMVVYRPALDIPHAADMPAAPIGWAKSRALRLLCIFQSHGDGTLASASVLTGNKALPAQRQDCIFFRLAG